MSRNFSEFFSVTNFRFSYLTEKSVKIRGKIFIEIFYVFCSFYKSKNYHISLTSVLVYHGKQYGPISNCLWWIITCKSIPNWCLDFPGIFSQLELLLEQLFAISQFWNQTDFLVKIQVVWFAKLTYTWSKFQVENMILASLLSYGLIIWTNCVIW